MSATPVLNFAMMLFEIEKERSFKIVENCRCCLGRFLQFAELKKPK